MKPELLAPAGDFECFKQALYNGADAIYLATDKFGARAYAKNFTLDELKKALILSHELNKKIYVTVNTMLKENEVLECKEYIKELYSMGVDGLILSDFSMINYVINNCPNMEAHISTQAGLKDFFDVAFFKELGAKRCVLARENSIEEIRKIKEILDIELEVFMHGALCVSYSGGCLFSSLLSLRSGNRGRCSQNCRREYTLYKDDNALGKGFYLSMRDLNTSDYLSNFSDIDSLKIEGRMKDPEYVKIVVSEYRKKLDDNNYKPKLLDTIFHRNYTKGFIFNEDKGNIVDINKRTNEGSFIGIVDKKIKDLTILKLNKPLRINDRIRLEGEEDYYFTIDKMYNLNNKEITEGTSSVLVKIFKDIKEGTKIYKMIDSSIDLTITNTYKKGITIKCYGSVDKELKLVTKINGIEFIGLSEATFSIASNKPINEEIIFNQLNKLNDTSFYLEKIDYKLAPNLFMTISQINEARRNLINNINNYFQYKKDDFTNYNHNNTFEYIDNPTIISAYCTTLEQYNMCKKLGIKDIYYDSNYIAYVNPKYEATDDLVLVGNYGGLYKYKDKFVVSDYSFNVANSDTLYNLYNSGVDVATLSYELSINNIKDIYNGYINNYKTKPNIEIITYGHQLLMTTKYCMLKRYNECSKCNNHIYYLKDEKNKFLTLRKNCTTYIYNEKALNLIDELGEITKYTNRIRLQFTVEKANEVEKVINNYKEKLNNMDTNKLYFDSLNETRGYYKREIL